MRKDAGLPKGWEKCCIRDIAEVIVSPVDKHSLENEEKVLLCNYTDIYYNSNITQDMCFMEATASYNEIKKFSLQVNDVVITKDSETPEDIGVPAYVASVKENLLCGYHLAILRPKKRTDGKFLMYALMNKKVANDFYRYSNGITRFGLTSDAYNKVRMLMPPLGEQKEIADVLSKWDEAIEITKRLIKAKEKRFRALANQLLSDVNGNSKYYLEELEKKQLISMGRGNVIPKTDFLLHPGDYPVYSSAVKNNGVFGRYGKYMFDEELITWSVDGGGHFFYRDKHKFSVTNVCGYIKVDTRKIDYHYMASYLQYLHRNLHFDYQTKAHPSVIRKIYRIALLPLHRQKEIFLCPSYCGKRDRIVKAACRKIPDTKRGLMQKLLTGEWRVKAKAQGGK